MNQKILQNSCYGKTLRESSENKVAKVSEKQKKELLERLNKSVYGTSYISINKRFKLT